MSVAGGTLILWDRLTRKAVTLENPFGGGAESDLYEVKGRPGVVAAVPACGGDYPAEKWEKIEALAGRSYRRDRRRDRVAVPVGILVDPIDRARRRGFLMPRLSGHTLDTLGSPRDMEVLGLRWGPIERAMLGVLLCDLFVWAEREGIRLADHNPPNYLFEADPRTNLPVSVSRVDPLAFAFHHHTYFGTDAARAEFCPPELVHLIGPGKLGREQLGHEVDRFGLCALLFFVFTGVNPVDYAHGNPDPAERVANKEFIGINMPQGARVDPQVLQDFFDLPDSVRNLIHQGLTGEPAKRPEPDKLRAALKAMAAGKATDPAETSSPISIDVLAALRGLAGRLRLNPWQVGTAACLALAVLALNGLDLTGPTSPHAPMSALGVPTPDTTTTLVPTPPVDPTAYRRLLRDDIKEHTDADASQIPPPPTPPTDPGAWRRFLPEERSR